MAKQVLTPEEVAAKKVRRSNGWTRFFAILLSLILVGGSTAFAKSKADTANEEAAKKQEELMSQYAQSVNAANSNSNFDGADSSDGSGDAAGPASNEAQEAADKINAATAEAAKAGYDWERSAKMMNLSVGGSTFTNILNGIIQGIDPNANLESVVGGFIGTGDKKATVKKGGNPAEDIGYHGESYKLKATSLKAGDLKDLKIEGDTYTFSLPNVNTPKKDGSCALSRLTDDIVVKEEVTTEIQAAAGDKVSVTGLDGDYTDINVTMVITDGKLVSFTYSYKAKVNDLALKAGVTIHGTGDMETTATYSNFVY
uniref:Uncharacterized protein n=1 Tax=uncultured prokaryote TaxID=198431 RepID=A0A0H5Q4A7_9ZZZZ|nr:hypothetical protein [uncultured prokaryote]